MIASAAPSSIRPRLTFVDSLRGFALFGVFGANLLIFSGYTFLTAEQRAMLPAAGANRVVHVLELFLIENKFIGLFSTLFGVSFWLFLDRARARGGPATVLFYRRIAWLFVFGALHGGLLWCFDVLRFYALWGLLLPVFVRVPLRRLLGSAMAAAVLAPAVVAGLRSAFASPSEPGIDYDALALAAFSTGTYRDMLVANWQYDWYLTNSIGQIGYQLAVFGRLLLGLWAARALDLSTLPASRALLQRVLLIGGGVGVVGNAIFAADWGAGAGGFVLPFFRRLAIESGHLGFTLAYAAALARLFASPHWGGAVRQLAPYGQMALSAYLLQTAFGIWLFYGWAPGPHLMGRIGPAWLAVIWLAGCGIQVAVARAWMRHFRFGPAEWLWRTLTYQQRQPLRVGRTAAM